MKNEIIKEFRDLREKAISFIVENKNLSILEKLHIIDKERLFDINPYVIDIFKEQEEKLNKIVKEKLNEPNRFIFTDDVFNNFKRRYFVNFYEFLSYLKENNKNKDISVVTNKHTDDKITMTYEELEEHIFDWSIKNRVIGFINDW